MNSILFAYFLHHFNLGQQNNSLAAAQTQNVVSTTNAVLSVEHEQATVRSFPRGSTRIPFLNLSLKTSCDEDVILDGITVRHRGLGSAQDISSVYLLADNRRITRGRTVPKDGEVHFNIRNIVIKACSTKLITVAADISADAAIDSQHGFYIDDAKDVSTNSNVYLSARPDLKQNNVYRTATKKAGTINVTYANISSRIKYGLRRKVMRFLLKADSVSNHKISAITISNRGSAKDDNLKNIFIETGTQVITPVVSQMNGDSIDLIFDPPFILNKNQERLFSVRADVMAKRSRTVQLIIEEPSDIISIPVSGR
ncbi:hypothetical protein HN512_01220 [Candidatus Peregrinibacteria bacterium]|jgi:hypothetical protein|nr:hypothetical protein [Candidatus Peregrinibacteria bacterium]MBT3598438.1 hypothetical protein [Candidatus Peregrinibacteria bacterium]MBT4367067.1 hypothetical protein [Candidatus Peregrinibacteria bacterium]MBT4585347.1 hypothetical protein [Candidatus Peregrinibacteria bacterium]MBT6730893.1 hypothetical protein [Candidatus Peregrinibacteria bacterium]